MFGKFAPFVIISAFAFNTGSVLAQDAEESEFNSSADMKKQVRVVNVKKIVDSSKWSPFSQEHSFAQNIHSYAKVESKE